MTIRGTVLVLLAALALACRPSIGPAAEPTRYFKIQVVDDQTGRGVPLVELKTVNHVRYYTDSAGLVAFYEPGLMNQKVFFYVKSHGYEFPKDGFGFAGAALDVKEAGSAQLKVKRLNIAERLYRVTGEGVYRDSVLLGEPVPLRQPVLSGKVFGQDSVQPAVYRGKIYWFWGDTNRPRYPLGHFGTAGAVSELPGRGGLDPAVGVDLAYFVDEEGFSRKMCPMTRNVPIMVWLDGILTVPGDKGEERLVARYAQMKSLGEMLEQGLAVFNDRTETFEKALEFDLKDRWRHLQGHPVRLKDGGEEYALFPMPYPVVRVRADLKRVSDPAAYTAFTCLEPGAGYEKAASKIERGPDGKAVWGWKPGTDPVGPAEEKQLLAAGKLAREDARFQLADVDTGTRYDKASSKIERGPDGKAVWGWKPGTDPVGPAEEKQLLDAGKLAREDARFQLADVDTGKAVAIHSGSFHWNAFRHQWVMIGVQQGGTSFLGEVWFAEADAPVGPWRWAKKVVTHEQYSFYNPAHHPFFDQEGGRLIYFEGTYAETFSGNPSPTPRYDYNQVMYRLDLADPRLKQPLEPPKARAAPLN